MSRPPNARPSSRLLAVAGLMFLVLAALAVPANAQVPPAGPGTIPGAWIVTLQPGQAPERVSDEHARQHGAQVDHVYRHALNGYAARMSDQKAARVAQDPRVASVERDQVVTIAAPPTKSTTSTTVAELPTGVDRIDGELSKTARIDGKDERVNVDVAVLDTGIASHPDLVIAGGKNCTSGKPSYADGNGHGTHVAGTIAAKDDGAGVVGVAPGARLWAVKVLSDQGSGTRSQIICGVDWVTGKKDSANGPLTIEVVNMSLGGGGTDPTGAGCATGDSYHDAICKSVAAGVTYVVAAGNSSKDAKDYVPAAYDEVITVSALADFDGKPGGGGAATCRADVDDTFADFSNYGADVDLIAPGVCIRSTWLKNGFNTISGTSMAAPHVAGAAALYKASNGTAAPAQVQVALQAAGTTDWNDVDDKDTIKEPLLNVAGF